MICGRRFGPIFGAAKRFGDDDDDGLVFYARKKTIACSLAWNRRDGGRARRARGWIARRSLTRFYRAIGKIWILFFSSLVVKTHPF